MYNLFCPWESAKYLIFSSNVPQLLFYSHIPAVAVSVLLGLLVFFNNKKSLVGKLLLGLATVFSLWTFFDLILWATNRTDITMFFWSLQILVEVFIFIICFYFVFFYIKNRFPPFWINLISFVLVVPFVLLIPTKSNLLGVDLSNCFALESSVIIFYTYILEIIVTISIIIFTLSAYRRDATRKKEIIAFFFGVTSFLLAFSFGNIIGSFTDNWVVAQYGLFGMPVFMALLVYIIVRYQAFNTKLIATQALVWGTGILIGAQFLFIKVPLNKVLNGITFILVVVFGHFLIKSVKREVEQKEQLAKLNINLQNLIQQRESLVHLITHKVKGSFTHTKYIFAGILEGMYGEPTPALKKIAEFGMESDDNGVKTVDLILNAANLQKGTVKFDMKNIDLKNIVQTSINERKDRIAEKGLELETKFEGENFMINGDAFWLTEVTNNLVENALRYTLKGKIVIGLSKHDDKVLFSVKDSGVGINEEDKQNLFKEGGRGKESVKVNVDSTGYGLYTVKLVVDAHGGRVWAESTGKDQGSTFYVEFNAI